MYNSGYQVIFLRIIVNNDINKILKAQRILIFFYQKFKSSMQGKNCKNYTNLLLFTNMPISIGCTICLHLFWNLWIKLFFNSIVPMKYES